MDQEKKQSSLEKSVLKLRSLYQQGKVYGNSALGNVAIGAYSFCAVNAAPYFGVTAWKHVQNYFLPSESTTAYKVANMAGLILGAELLKSQAHLFYDAVSRGDYAWLYILAFTNAFSAAIESTRGSG